eukprot:gene15546-61855_t
MSAPPHAALGRPPAATPLRNNSACAAPTSGVGGPNMNGKPYEIMTHDPSAPVKFPGVYSEIDPEYEWFDTLYGQVYWTMMDGTPLPPEIVSRFDGKVMACNQVQKDPAGGPDIPVPINAAYNHHHGATVIGKHAALRKVAAPSGARDPASVHGHVDGDGYMWAGRPTRHFVPGPQPRNSFAPSNGSYSGLLECPCTDRITKVVDGATSNRAAGSCAQGAPATLKECGTAAGIVTITV